MDWVFGVLFKDYIGIISGLCKDHIGVQGLGLE